MNNIHYKKNVKNRMRKNNINYQFSNILQIVVISRIKSYFLHCAGLQYFGLTVKQIPSQDRILTLPQILKRFELSFEDQKSILIDMMDAMEGTYLKNRYKQEEFDSFFMNMMKGDPCEVIKKYPQFIDSKNEIEEEKCQRQQKILKNGLLIAIKAQMAHFKDVYQELKDVPSDKLQKIHIIDYNEQTNTIISLLDNLTYFIQVKNEEYYDYIVNCQIYLMFYQFFILTVIFYLSWIFFYRFIDKQLHETKLSLSFLHLINLVSNPYIQSYFQQKNIS